MKNLQHLLLISFSWIGIFSSASNASGLEAEKITVAADQWCPFFCESGQEFDGFSVELIRMALKSFGAEMDYVNAPFARITIQVESGRWHIHGGTDHNFTPKLLIGKEEIARSRWVFVKKASNPWVYMGSDSLKGKIFGAVTGYVYSPELTGYYNLPANKSRMVELAADAPQKQVLMMLLSGRVDFLVEDENVVRYWASRLGMMDQIAFAGVDSEVSFYTGYRHNNKAAALLADNVDKGLRQVKSDKALMDRLLKKYGITNWR